MNDEQRKQLTRDLENRTIESFEWQQPENGFRGYWVMTFVGGGEMCVITMVELKPDELFACACGKSLTSLISSRKRPPAPGEFAFCTDCGRIYRFGTELSLKELTMDQIRNDLTSAEARCLAQAIEELLAKPLENFRRVYRENLD